MRLSERVDHVEAALVKHLEESGNIRTDLAWLKKAFWTLSGAVIVAIVAQAIRPVSGAYHDQSNVPQVQQKP